MSFLENFVLMQIIGYFVFLGIVFAVNKFFNANVNYVLFSVGYILAFLDNGLVRYLAK